MEIVFVTKNEIIGNSTNIVNVILSNHYYWYKTKQLPVKFIFQAKQMAPSLFVDESKNNNFEYQVSKIDKNNFSFIAYDKVEIIDKLERLGLNTNKINKIYFAQDEFLDIKQDLNINQDTILSVIDGFVAVLALKNQNHRYVKNILKTKKLISKGINLKVDESKYEVLKKPIIALTVLCIVLMIQLFSDKGILNSVVLAKKDILSQYNLPTTNFQLKSIVKKYETIDKEQKFIRESIYHILTLKFNKGDFIQKILYNNDNTTVYIKVSEFERVDKYKKLLNEMNFKPSKFNMQNEIFVVTYSIANEKDTNE